MKQCIYLAVFLLISCTATPDKNTATPDKRDKYVGEYAIYKDSYWWGERKSYNWNHYTNSYEMETYSHSSSDSSLILIIQKSPFDTVSLELNIVKPFNFTHAEEIKKKNEEIKKRNAESICGEDEKLLEVPVPSFGDRYDLVFKYNGYINGHKVFIRDYNYEYIGGYGSGYTMKTEFDSIYLLNDTLHYKSFSRTEYFYKQELTDWRNTISRCIAVKKNEIE